jgi:hypothetical protein
MPWRTDWRVGHEWPRAHFASLDFRDLKSPYDVKYPWELSRFYFAPALALASHISGKTEYRGQLLALAHDWDRENPVAYSINWASALEVALRATHLASAVPLLPELAEGELRFLLGQIAVAGAFVRRNLEYSELRGNHYVGNLYGLLVCGLLLRGIMREADQWVSFAAEEIPKEVLLQFSDDGVNFEGSLPYHRFTLEMCLFSLLVMRGAGLPFRPDAEERLRTALLLLAAAVRPDGTLPVWGDNDDANALQLADRPLELSRRALAIGAVLFKSGEMKHAAGRLTADALLLLGTGAEETWSALDAEPPRRCSFPEGGFLIASGNGNYLIFDVGEVGLRGRGGHGHHDALSFELWLKGKPLIIDPGMPTYSGDAKLRNRFRSTKAHNTAVVNGREQATLFDDDIWRLGAEAEIYEVEEQRDGARHLFAASHRGFERLAQPVQYRRTLELDLAASIFRGSDRFDRAGQGRVDIPFQFAPEVELRQSGNSVEVRQGSDLYLFTTSGAEIEIQDSEVSPAYGVRVPARKISLKATGALPFEVRYALTPTGPHS